MVFPNLPDDNFFGCQKIRANVLIVSRTRMKDGFVCIGGFDMIHRCNIRLLSLSGWNQREDAPFRIGQIWNIVYMRKEKIQPPHFEDVVVESYELRGNMCRGDVREFIIKNCCVVYGSPEYLFGGCLQLIPDRGSYIDVSCVPGYSVCFWVPDVDLVLTYDGLKYRLKDSKYNSLYKYVGCGSAVKKISKGSLVRMSLARWWRNPELGKYVCYLQLSGWF